MFKIVRNVRKNKQHKVKKMNNKKKSRKLLLITTALTIVALASVLFVYASVTLFTATGGNVTVSGVTTGTIDYSTTNTVGGDPWSTILSTTSGGSWYAELLISSGNTYKGPVTVTWQLQSEASGTFTNDGSAVTTDYTLATGAQTIYASPTGILTGNLDWHTVDSAATTYQIVVTVASAP